MLGEGVDDGDYDCDNNVDDVDNDFVVRLRIQDTVPLSDCLSSLVGGGQPSQSAVYRGFVTCEYRRHLVCSGGKHSLEGVTSQPCLKQEVEFS